MPRRLCQYCTAKLGRFAKLLFIVTCKNCAYRMSMGTSPRSREQFWDEQRNRHDQPRPASIPALPAKPKEHRMLDAEELNAMQDRAKRAHDHVCDIASGKSRWKMTIPANEETDSDLLLAASVTDVPLLVAEVEKLKAERDSFAKAIANVVVLGQDRLSKDAQDVVTELLRLDHLHDPIECACELTQADISPTVSVPTHHTPDPS
jgi:hypothetical protein